MPKKDKGGIPTPDVIDPPESMSMTLCIPKNKDHMMAFFGALWELTMWDSWQPDEAHTGKELAAVWLRYWMSWDRSMNDIECEDGMANCCTEPAITLRVNPETGNVEQSTNGGASWSPAAGGIQSVILQPVPPVTSGVAATKCDAATNVMEQVQGWIDNASNGFVSSANFTEFGFAIIAAVAGAVLVVLTGGGFTPIEIALLTALGAGITAAWGAGKIAFDAYWTTDVKNKIFCAAFCWISEDGSFTAQGFSGFWHQVNEDIPGSPAKLLFMGFLSSVGQPGLNAMAATGFSADGDCSDCIECLACAEQWSVFGAAHGTILEQTEEFVTVQASDGGNGNFYVILKTATVDTCCAVDHLEAVSGSASLHGWTDCGQPQVEGVPQHTGTGFGTCMNYVQLQDAAAFTVKIFFVECP